MGIGIAIATIIAVVATVTADVAFGVVNSNKQKELEREIEAAQRSATTAQNFYDNTYKVVKSRLEKVQQSMTKLPPNVLDQLGNALSLNLDSPKSIQYVGWALGGAAVVTGTVASVASVLINTGRAAAQGIVSTIGTVAGAAGLVLAVAGFGFSLYNGITQLNKLNDAIAQVKEKKRKSDEVIQKMQTALDGLLTSMNLRTGNYAKLVEISNDWSKLSKNFDDYSTAFYYAIRRFSKGNNLSQVKQYLAGKNYKSLNDNVLSLAKIMQDEIYDFFRAGRTDSQIVNFYAKENPNEGLRFVLNEFFISTLRENFEDSS